MSIDEIISKDLHDDSSQIESIVEDDLVELIDEPEDINVQSPLHNKYAFWYHRRGNIKQNANYDESIIKVSTCQTVEHFWRIYDHLIHPNEIKVSLDYHFFKEGIKPVWEDPNNKAGGKWMVRVKKGLSSHYWEELLIAIIGEQFDVGSEICGAVISIRQENDIISVWNKTSDNIEASNRIRDQMRKSLRLPAHVPIEYKKHQESLEDKTSFRNPSIVWRASNREPNENRNQTNRPPGYQNRSQSYQQYNQSNNNNNISRNNTQQNSNSNNSFIPPPSNTSLSAPIVTSKEPAKSRWDALKSDQNAQTSSPRTGWRAPANTSWSKDRDGKDRDTNKTHASDKESTSDKTDRKIEQDSEQSNTNDNNSSESTGNQESKGRNIGSWVKSQLIKGQAESLDKPEKVETNNTSSTSNTSTISSTTAATQSNPWKKSTTPGTNPWSKGTTTIKNSTSNAPANNTNK